MPATPDEVRRFEAAKIRKQLRAELAQREAALLRVMPSTTAQGDS